MRVLTENNTEFDMSVLSKYMTNKGVIEYTDEKIFYTVIDWTKQKLPDYMCRDLEKNKIDSYTDAAVKLQIGNREVILPYKWHMLIVSLDEVQYLSIEEIAGRDFDAFGLNPFAGYMPNFLPIRVVAIINKHEFIHPKLGKQEMLAIPIGFENDTANKPRAFPTCIFAGEKACRVPPQIEIGKLFS